MDVHDLIISQGSPIEDAESKHLDDLLYESFFKKHCEGYIPISSWISILICANTRSGGTFCSLKILEVMYAVHLMH